MRIDESITYSVVAADPEEARERAEVLAVELVGRYSARQFRVGSAIGTDDIEAEGEYRYNVTLYPVWRGYDGS